MDRLIGLTVIASVFAVGAHVPGEKWTYTAAASVAEVKAAYKTALIEVRPTVPAIMQTIADCESGNGTPGSGRQFEDDGTVMKGKKTDPRFGEDVGKWQINTKYHAARAKALGMDLATEYGNERYAMLLYREQGTVPWEASRPCWSK